MLLEVCKRLVDGTFGTEIAELTDDALAARAERTTLFCRVNPAQKARIIGALRQRGHTVGYLGDGINDCAVLAYGGRGHLGRQRRRRGQAGGGDDPADGALLLGFIAALFPERGARWIWPGMRRVAPAAAMAACVYLALPWFRF